MESEWKRSTIRRQNLHPNACYVFSRAEHPIAMALISDGMQMERILWGDIELMGPDGECVMKKFMFVLMAITLSCAADVVNAQILYMNDYDYDFVAAPVYVNNGLSSGPIYAGAPRLPAN